MEKSISPFLIEVNGIKVRFYYALLGNYYNYAIYVCEPLAIPVDAQVNENLQNIELRFLFGQDPTLADITRRVEKINDEYEVTYIVEADAFTNESKKGLYSFTLRQYDLDKIKVQASLVV